MTPLIEVRDLHFQYEDGTKALDGVNFTLYAGETVAVLGANGSGKTTFVLHLNGILRGTGSVSVCGMAVNKDTLARVLPFWNSRIAPELRAGRNVLVAAHGNSLRAMVKMLDNVPEKDIVELNIPTGVPLLYELDPQLKPLGSRYLGDPAAIAAAAEAVRRQTEKR